MIGGVVEDGVVEGAVVDADALVVVATSPDVVTAVRSLPGSVAAGAAMGSAIGTSTDLVPGEPQAAAATQSTASWTRAPLRPRLDVVFTASE